MHRVLVTGARGLLGCTLVPFLRAADYEVISHSRDGAGAQVAADLAQLDQVLKMLDGAKPDAIVNLAALTNVDECEANPNQAYLANVRIVENLAGWIQRSGGRTHLVQLSTDQVYDGRGPHLEDDVALTNYYAFSKYAGELAAAAVSATVLRTNFFGPTQCPSRSSLSDWLVDSLEHGSAITVFEDVLFSPLSLESLAAMISRVLERPRSGTFNLGSRQGLSKADFAFALARAMELPTERVRRGSAGDAPRAAYRPRDMRMDSTLFERAFDTGLPTLSQEIDTMRSAYGR